MVLKLETMDLSVCIVVHLGNITNFDMFCLMLKFRYLAHGTATDFMYDIVKVPMAFTFEVCEM